MAEQKVNPLNKKFIKNNLSDAMVQSVSDVAESGIDISELVDAIDNEPAKLIADSQISETALNKLASDRAKGVAIPGQSLVNDPKNPYPWEKPAKFANPREALTSITTDILEPVAMKGIIKSLADGIAVTDIVNTILYTKFVNGEINPDTMLLLAEPIMYTVMSIGSEAGIEYNIEPNDIGESDEVEVNERVAQFRQAAEDIRSKKQITDDNKDTAVARAEKVIGKNLLDKIKDKGPEMRSLLNKQEEVV
tara:strand:- start:1236 stop:1985 length:750 start_codon:yes stop_codon:yes gene_type:complete